MELSQLISEQYEQFRNYIPSAFTDSPSSKFDSVIQSLTVDQAKLLKEIYDFKDNINVLTANTEGVTGWEAFLGLQNRPDLSLQARRGRLFSYMVQKDNTIKTMGDVVKSYIGSDQFTIFEYWTLSDPASAFVWEVQINTPNTASYIKSDLEYDLVRLQPAHCTLLRILDTFKYLADTLSTSDSVSTTLLSVFQSDISQCDNSLVIVS
jgi:hypothetical protein